MRARRRREHGLVPPEASYFGAVYPARTRTGTPAQSAFDRLRDRHLTRLVKRHAPPVEHPTLLDVGCGYGWLLERLAPHFGAFGIDISPHAVDEARSRVAAATIAVGDLADGIVFPRRFDIVVAVNVLEHMQEPELAIDALVAATEPGGAIVVHLPTVNGVPSARAYERLYGSDVTHVYRPSARELRDRFDIRGVRVIHEAYAPYAPSWLWRHVRVHPAYVGVFRRGER